MAPDQPVQTPDVDPRAPRPGYYFAPPPVTFAPPSPRPAPRTTWRGRWGLLLSGLALVLPVLAVVALDVGGVTGRAAPAVGLRMLLALVFAVLGIALSAAGMSHRYAGRGLAVAGLAIGIVSLAPLALGVLLFSGG
jgi:hypothetical protein